MRRRVSRLALIAVTAGVLGGVSVPASAEGEPCLSDAECVGPEHCYEAMCTAADAEFDVCDEKTPETCEPDAVCVQGYCKRDVPVCRNELGACFVGPDAGSCACASAPGVDWTGEPPDVGSQSDDPTGRCFDLLAATCPASVPEPECVSDAQRLDCEAFVSQENALNVACGGEPNDDPERIAGAIEFCCQEYDAAAVATYRACILGLSQDDCAGFEVCSGGGSSTTTGPGGSTGPNEGPEDDGAEPFGASNSDDEAVGCRVSGGPGWLAIAVLGVALGRRRRRRRDAAAQ